MAKVRPPAQSGAYVPQVDTQVGGTRKRVFSVQPDTADGPSVFSVEQSTFNGTPEAVTSWGVNQNPGGTLITAGKPGFVWNIEPNYNDGTGANKIETYCQYLPSSGSGSIRPLFFQINMTTNAVIAQVTSDSFTVIDRATAGPHFAVNKGFVTFTPGGGGAAAHTQIMLVNTTNVMWLYDQPNGAAGAAISVGSNNNSAVGFFANVSDVGVKGLVARGKSGQTGNLLELQDNTGAYLSGVSENGYITTKKKAAPADAELANSEVAIWLDDTAGTPVVKFKGKDSAGTVFTKSL